MEHLTDYRKKILEIKRVLKPDGVLFVAVPLESEPFTLYKVAFDADWDLKRKSVGHVNAFNNKNLTLDFKELGLVKQNFVYAGHILNQIGDFLYYFLIKSKKDLSFSFDSGIHDMDSGFGKKIMIAARSFFSAVSYFESKLFWFLPGGRGHYILKKSDFFSVNKPITVCDDFQIKYGLKKAVRPKDIFIANFLKDWGVINKSKILDFGCADGLWLERITKNGVGVDVSPRLINLANARKTKNKYFVTGDKWPLKGSSFDYCVSFDVFEHVKDKELEIKRIFSSLKKGGKFLFYTINPNNKFTFDWMFESLGSNYLYDRADHDKKLFPDPSKFKKSLEKAGFKSVNYSLYDGPFNLFWDVFAYSLLSIFPSKNLYIINDKIVRFVYPINLFLDKMFTAKGYSNGYFIWGEK